MKKPSLITFVLICVSAIAGCAPCSPTHLPPGLIGMQNIGWIFLAFIIFGIVIFRKNINNNSHSPNKGYITEALNKITEQLLSLEEKVERLEKEIKSQD